MGKVEPVYERGTLAKVVEDIVSNSPEKIYFVNNIINEVQKVLPKARRASIRSLLTVEYLKRRWAVPTDAYDEFVLTPNFKKKLKRGPKERKESVLIKSGEDELTLVEIGRAMVAYINELKTLADIAEEDNVKLTKQVNVLQDAYNAVKTNGAGVSVKDILNK